MSYKYPPKKNRDDEELLDDKWSQPAYQPNDPFVTPSRKDTKIQAIQPPSGQLSGTNYTTNLLPGQSSEVTPLLVPSLTQEDILFVRAWKRESFFYRVVPLTALGWGALFMYEKSKKLPHTVFKYLLVGTSAFIIGKLSYFNEFRRRLAESRSNTPFMQASRKAVGLQPIVGADIESEPILDYSNGGVPGWSTSEPQVGKPFSNEASQFRQPAKFDSMPNTLDKHGGEISKPITSYEELRAQNRGLIK